MTRDIPLRLGAVAVLVIVLMLLAAFWDPLGLRARSRDKREQMAASLEQMQRLHTAQQAVLEHQKRNQHQHQVVALSTDRAVTAAHEQTDAKTELGAERRHRLDEHDRSLCQQAPTMAGCKR